MSFHDITKHFLNDPTIEGGGHVFSAARIDIGPSDFGAPGYAKLCFADSQKPGVKGTAHYPNGLTMPIVSTKGQIFLAVSHGVPDSPASPSVDKAGAYAVFDEPVNFFKQYHA